MGEDIFVEVSHGPTLVDNNLLLSDYACRLSTQGVAMVHNLIAGSFTKVGTGTDNGGLPRYTPYHEPHGTKINGFMTFLHGDMRFFNNIFIQQRIRYCFDEDMEPLNIHLNKENGTFVYNDYPNPEEYEALFADGNLFCYDRYYTHLPVTTQGNVFCNGAKPCRTEQDYAVAEEPVSFLLEQREDGWYFTFTGKLPDCATELIDTEKMGEAFEPEQRFEAPDGTDIRIDRDYFDVPMAEHPVPGCFAEELFIISKLMGDLHGDLLQNRRILLDVLVGELGKGGIDADGSLDPAGVVQNGHRKAAGSQFAFFVVNGVALLGDPLQFLPQSTQGADGVLGIPVERI